ncbi:MAG: (Fe-S)-binding protein [archaeon]
MFKFLEKLTNRNTLYYPGCMTKYVLKDKEEQYKRILERIGVDFIMLKNEELCCGSPVLNAGYKEDFEELKRKNLEKFKKYGVRRIITNCPACCNIFKKEYGLEAEHISQVVLKNIDKIRDNNKIKSNNPNEEINESKINEEIMTEEITYHDSCHLGRHGKIYEEPRGVLKNLGIDVKEFDENRERSVCCGAGGGFKNNLPNLANDVAKDVLKKVKTEKLITCCPMCYQHFKDNSGKIKVVEFGDVLV